ncbi:EamA family transporter [Candidatus Bipolaricaulota bacterium]
MAGPLPESPTGKALFLLSQFRNPWILSGFAAAGLAALCWMAALTQFDLTHAYPFMSLSFVLVLILSSVLLGESVTTAKVIGIALILAGILMSSRG